MQDGVHREEVVAHRAPPTKNTIKVEDDVGVDDSRDSTNIHSDLSAEVSKGDCKAMRFKLKDLFSKSEGPDLVPTWTGNARQF